MKYYLITGRIPAREAVPATDTTPEIPAQPEQDNRILIGESNPFDTGGKPFKPARHEDYGIITVDNWKRLIIIYGERITHEYIVTTEGLRQQNSTDIVPASHLFALLNDGFAKEGRRDGSVDKVIYWKQKGRIEDDNGKTYTTQEMIKILEDK